MRTLVTLVAILLLSTTAYAKPLHIQPLIAACTAANAECLKLTTPSALEALHACAGDLTCKAREMRNVLQLHSICNHGELCCKRDAWEEKPLPTCPKLQAP